MSKDDFGDRIKSNYEDRTRFYLPRRTYTLIRVDGKSFHSYTKKCERPYDLGLIHDMNQAAVALCENISGAQFGYVQSDEISILATDFATPATEAWFDNNLQKVVSVSASLATMAFNKTRLLRTKSNFPAEFEWANFDSRAFTIADRQEVINYFIWRQLDAIRNSVSMVAREVFSHKQLDGKSTKNMKQMLQDTGHNWGDANQGFRQGRAIVKRQTIKDVVFLNKRTQMEERIEGIIRNEWCIEDAPFFVETKEFLQKIIPTYSEGGKPDVE